MFETSILDVAIGLVFVFMMVSLLTGALVEGISGLLRMRSATLLQGIRELLNDPNLGTGQLSALVAGLYQHALVNPRNAGTATTANDLSAGGWSRLWSTLKPHSDTTTDLGTKAPSYIDPRHFAEALIDVLGATTLNGDIAGINAAIDAAVPAAANPQVNQMLKRIALRAGGNLVAMKAEIAAWFDNAMDRLSGVYKRWTQLANFVIAFLVAILLNINAIHVAKVVWQRPLQATTIENITRASTEKLPANKEAAVQQMVAAIELPGLLPQPIGWAHYKLDAVDRTEPLEFFAGWLLTAIATLFGAPFWFDLLQLFVRLKSSGPSPKEKEQQRGAAA